jgi:hypothetical protein
MSGNSSNVLTAATLDPVVRDSAEAESDAPISGTRPSEARAPALVQARIDSFFDGLEPVFVIDSPTRIPRAA